jgi:hypothetical protein
MLVLLSMLNAMPEEVGINGKEKSVRNGVVTNRKTVW